MEKEKTLRLKNGIEIYGYKNPALHSFYISLFVRAGSMYEEICESGMTHFLEHVLIRNVNSLMGGKLYETVDSHGIEFNASTYSEMVQFYILGGSSKFSVASSVITKLLEPLSLSAKDIAAERERIKAEIRESDDRTSLSSFSSAIVYEGTSLSRPILGTLGGVSDINGKRLEEYRKKIFTSENIFFYVTGNYSENDLSYLASLIEEFDLPHSEKRTNTAPVPEKFGKREPKIHIKNADFTMLRFSFDMDMSSILTGTDDLIYDILLGGYNSRFFIEMSEKKGLFYDLTGAVEKYGNIGSFTFSYEVRGGSVPEALETTLSILSELKNSPLPEGGLMKAGYVDNRMLLYDDVRELNFTFAYDRHIMNAPYSNTEERAEHYRKIKPDDIMNAAREIFKPENLTLTMKGNRKKTDTEHIEAIVKNFK